MKRKSNENSTGSGLIEQQICAVFNGLVANLPEKLVALRAKPAKGSIFCKGLIQIFNKAEIEKASEKKGIIAYPLETYAFYMKDFQDSKLESIAIYAQNVTAKYFTLRRRGYLFGYRIASIKIETGRRLFLDVKLAV